MQKWDDVDKDNIGPHCLGDINESEEKLCILTGEYDLVALNPFRTISQVIYREILKRRKRWYETKSITLW